MPLFYLLLSALTDGLRNLAQAMRFSAQSAVKVLSAESEEDLFKAVTSWVETRNPEARVTVREFHYLADDRALLILKTVMGDGSKRSFYFETPGLPIQFVRRKS